MSQRPGFNIPNSATVSAAEVAEPDSGDFSILGNHRNGILTGCDYTLNTTTGEFHITTGGTAVVDSVPVTVGTGVLTVTSGGPRFVLIAVTSTGSLVQTSGQVDTDNPVFPDVPNSVAVIAAVYVPASGAMTAVDKRQFLTNGAYGERISGNFLEHRYEGITNFTVSYTGDVGWGAGNPVLAPGGDSLEIQGGGLLASGRIETEDGLVVAGDATVDGDVTASNLRRGSGAPSGGEGGDLYQRYPSSPGGAAQLYFHDGNLWQPVAPAPIPVGTIISHITPPASSAAVLGPSWKALNGQVLNSASTAYADLWAVVPSGWKNVAENKILLPNTADRFLRGTSAVSAGTLSTGTGSVTLTAAHIPSHKHFDTTATGGKIRTKAVPAHDHNGSTAVQGTTGSTGGNHRHPGVDGGSGGGFVYTDVDGNSKLDGLFNDSSHTATVSWGSGTGTHGPTTANGAHHHVLDITPDGAVSPGIELATPEKTYGATSPTPVPVVPQHMTVYYYIKVV